MRIGTSWIDAEYTFHAGARSLATDDRKGIAMSLDPSLKITMTMTGKRSVLTRAERITKLVTDKKFDTKKDKALGLSKTLVGKG
jgi:small basic protein (TIGR04137 family)